MLPQPVYRRRATNDNVDSQASPCGWHLVQHLHTMCTHTITLHLKLRVDGRRRQANTTQHTLKHIHCLLHIPNQGARKLVRTKPFTHGLTWPDQHCATTGWQDSDTLVRWRMAHPSGGLAYAYLVTCTGHQPPINAAHTDKGYTCKPVHQGQSRDTCMTQRHQCNSTTTSSRTWQQLQHNGLRCHARL